MNVTSVYKFLNEYNANIANISGEIHQNDDMMKKSPRGWEDYVTVGRSSVELIAKALLFLKIDEPETILDFGCGHGRVARHLRVAFPDASLWFSDIDPTAWQFCTAQFGGTGFNSSEDFRTLEVPVKADLIFLGSVFTHLSWERSKILWMKLFDALNRGGGLIATFRGPTCYELMVRDTERLNAGGYYDQILCDYRETGFGYQDYKGFTDWGQNLWSFSKIAELAEMNPGARLACFAEAGWANVHDVAVWTRL